MLAARAGLSHSTVSRAEGGSTDAPDLGTLLKIAEAFGMKVEDFTGGTPPALLNTPTTGRVRRVEDVDLPVYRAHAGRLDFGPDGAIDVFSIRASQSYVVEVSGDCLEQHDPPIRDGDQLIVDRRLKPVVGDVVVVRIGDETFLGEWIKSNGGFTVRLSPDQLLEALYTDSEVLGVALKRVEDLRARLKGR